MGEELSFRKLNLPFLSIPASSNMHSPDHPSGSATPPLQTLASVPFKWEEQPGKPRPCTDIVSRPEPARFLDPPPCRIMSMDRLITKTPSPTAVLDGPYPKFSSFRFFREAHDSTSFYSSSSSCTVSPEVTDQVKRVLLSGNGGKKGRGYFGKFKKEVYGGSFRVFSSSSSRSFGEYGDYGDESCGGGVKMEKRKMRSRGSFSGGRATNKSTHIFATIYEGLKQVISWRSGKKSKKEVQF